jgi:hypothetical protein
MIYLITETMNIRTLRIMIQRAQLRNTPTCDN